VDKAGPLCVIQAGTGKRDHMRCAIQELSGEGISSTTVYEHTGWRDVGGRSVYLHAGGAIGSEGIVDGIGVSLTGSAANFCLPAPPSGSELRNAVRSSLDLLNGLVADPASFSLLASVYRAVLGPADYSLWLSGPTGSCKSELAALAEQHFGSDMTRTRLPGNWSSTDNALEGLAFTLKDAVFVVDDFCPSGSRQDHERMNRLADRLIRGVANSAGKLRMNADGSLRPPRPPRSLILGTGEDVPRGHSVAARLWIGEVEHGSVSLSRLSKCQHDACTGRYAAALSGFISWVAADYHKIRGGLDIERADLRDSFLGRYAHARTPDAVANLLLGLRYLLRYAEVVGAIDSAHRQELWTRGTAAFRVAAARQGEHQSANDPVARFADWVQTLLSAGRAHVAGPDGREPSAPPSIEFWGWERRTCSSGSDTSANWTSRGERIGWVDGDELYLNPDATYAKLVELARDQGATFPLSQETLYCRLREAGLLLRHDLNRNTTKVTLAGSRRRIIVISAQTTLSLSRPPGQAGHVGPLANSFEESPPSSAPDSEHSAPKRDGGPGHGAPDQVDISSTQAFDPPGSADMEGSENGKPRSQPLFEDPGMDALRR
jgi:hypothetical protein